MGCGQSALCAGSLFSVGSAPVAAPQDVLAELKGSALGVIADYRLGELLGRVSTAGSDESARHGLRAHYHGDLHVI